MEIKLIGDKKKYRDNETIKCILSNPETNDSYEIELMHGEYKFKKTAYKLLKRIPEDLKQEYLDLLDTIKQTTFMFDNLSKLNDPDHYFDMDDIYIPECDVFLNKLKNKTLKTRLDQLTWEYRMLCCDLATNEY